MKKYALLGVLGALVACGSSDPDAPAGPAPTDPVVYDASPETGRELGIVKWGFAADVGGNSVFHGYGSKNEALVEITQSFDQQDEFTKRMTVTMTGRLGEASEKIDFGVVVSDDFQDVSYTETVVENTFATGIPAKVLAHLTPDATAMAAAAPDTGEAPVLLQGQSLHPSDDNSSLVSKPTTLLQCCSTVSQQSAPIAASSVSNCSLISPSSSPIRSQSTGLRPDALVVGPNGKPTVQSPWSGPFDIVDHHCHNAAAQNSSTTDGYIACINKSSSTSTQGHTINWAPNPSGGAGNYCAYEPQSNGGTLLTNSVCCWSGSAGSDGAPLFNTPAAQGCVSSLCLGQADFPGWFRSWYVTPPTAFPAGSKPPTPNDCPSSTDALIGCNSCCTEQADRVGGLFGGDPKYAAQVTAYRKRCAVGCQSAETKRNPSGQSKPNQCTMSTLDWLKSKVGLANACKASN